MWNRWNFIQKRFKKSRFKGGVIRFYPYFFAGCRETADIHSYRRQSTGSASAALTDW